MDSEATNESMHLVDEDCMTRTICKENSARRATFEMTTYTGQIGSVGDEFLSRDQSHTRLRDWYGYHDGELSPDLGSSKICKGMGWRGTTVLLLFLLIIIVVKLLGNGNGCISNGWQPGGEFDELVDNGLSFLNESINGLIGAIVAEVVSNVVELDGSVGEEADVEVCGPLVV
ncbi:hypothetical protein ACLOJK_006110 [Asimina triloba]